MKILNHRTGTLTTLAVLLAGLCMGFIPLCELIANSEPETGDDIDATAEAGNTVHDLTLLDVFARIAMCELGVVAEGGPTAIPSGVYLRTSRDLRGTPSATVDLVTSASTPPGVYVIEYRKAGLGSYVTGTLNLTIQPGSSLVQACLYVFQGEGDVIIVNQVATFYGCCSLAPPEDPIVQYKWWFDYNGNPSSSPSTTTAFCEATHTYASTGTRTARLVVRTQSGEEAEDTQTINVVTGL